MITKPLVLGIVLIFAFVQDTNDEKTKKDLELMQGTWTIQALEINGKDVPAPQLDGTVLTVKKDEYQTKTKDMELFSFRIKLDPSKDPRAIDMIKKEANGTEVTYKGIYKIENGVFKMCRGLTADQARPNQFATWPDTGYFVVTWKKN